jgi:hypothetical protein
MSARDVRSEAADSGRAIQLDTFAAAAENRLAEQLASLGIRTVLVMVRRFMMPFGGVQLIAADLFKTFQQAGIKVTLATERSEDAFRALFPEIEDIIIFENDLRPMMNRSYDLVLTHGWTMAGLVLLECQVSFRHLVLCSFSSFGPGEVIYGFEEQADALLFESMHNLEAQAPSLTHCAAPRFCLRNALGRDWFVGDVSSLRDRELSASTANVPARVAIVSNHNAPELQDLVSLLSAQGSKVEVIGRPGEIRHFDLALTDTFDLIISIGATAQKALVRGVPLFCYDHFGGPGFINLSNLERAEHFNFSGRCTYNRRPGEVLLAQILDGYQTARIEAPKLAALARTRYCMADRLSEVVSSFSRREEPRSFGDPKYNNLRKLVHLQANNAYPTPIFSNNYMVNADEKPQLRMVEIVCSEDERINEISVRERSPYLFMGDQEVLFRFPVMAKLRGEEDVSRISIREDGNEFPVQDVQSQYRPRFDFTDVRFSISYPVTRDTRMFRIIAKIDNERPVELMRVRFRR